MTMLDVLTVLQLQSNVTLYLCYLGWTPMPIQGIKHNDVFSRVFTGEGYKPLGILPCAHTPRVLARMTPLEFCRHDCVY